MKLKKDDDQAKHAHESDFPSCEQSEECSTVNAQCLPTNHTQGLSRWVLAFALIVIGMYFLVFFRYPVVINSPGPTFDVLGKNSEGVSLIEIKGAKTYSKDNGQLRMTTVSSLGGPGSTVNGLDIIRASLNRNTQILPEEEVYPRQLSSKEIKTIGVQQMDQSQLAAESVALKSLGYQVDVTWEVADVPKKSPAFGILQPGDILRTISAENHPTTQITDIEVLHNFLDKVPPETEIKLGLSRKDSPLEVKFKTMKSVQGKGSQLGLLLNSNVKVPLDIKFHLKDVGGPSAGTMFALGIVEQLTPNNITSRHIVAGTGTIDLAGRVGPISGIPQKMAGAKKDGAKFFLAPASNCDEVDGNIPSGLKVTPIATFSDALHALKLIRENHGNDLPGCPSSKQKLS